MKYLSLPHLANYYDVHPDTLRRMFKTIDIIKDEHYVIMGKSIRFDVEKVHPLITKKDSNTEIDLLLERFLI